MEICLLKGFFKETAGQLTQWNGLTGATAEANLPLCTANPARQSLLRMFYSGQKVKLRTKLKFPITQSLDRAPLNSANRLTFQFQRNPNTYYLLAGANNTGATAPMQKDIATKAADCKIRINKFEIKTTMLEYNVMCWKNTSIPTQISCPTLICLHIIRSSTTHISRETYTIRLMFHQIQSPTD